MLCGILVPWPGIRPEPSALEAWSLNPCTAKEVLSLGFGGILYILTERLFCVVLKAVPTKSLEASPQKFCGWECCPWCWPQLTELHATKSQSERKHLRSPFFQPCCNTLALDCSPPALDITVFFSLSASSLHGAYGAESKALIWGRDTICEAETLAKEAWELQKTDQNQSLK